MLIPDGLAAAIVVTTETDPGASLRCATAPSGATLSEGLRRPTGRRRDPQEEDGSD